MQWVDILSGEKVEEHEFPEGFTCFLAERQLVSAESAKLTICYTETGVQRLTLELRFQPDSVQRLTAMGMLGMTPEFAAQLEPGMQPKLVLEAKPEVLAHHGEKLRQMADKVECLTIKEDRAGFPEFLKLGNYKLVRREQ